jgi:hypothetical protein
VEAAIGLADDDRDHLAVGGAGVIDGLVQQAVVRELTLSRSERNE